MPTKSYNLRATHDEDLPSIWNMESMRSTWTDERLDDFAAHTDRRFDDLERRMDAGFRRVDEEFREVRTEIRSLAAEVNGRFDALHRTMIRFQGSLIVSFVGLVIAFVLSRG